MQHMQEPELIFAKGKSLKLRKFLSPEHFGLCLQPPSFPNHVFINLSR